ncbi:hypothetical protein BURK_008751 [Burkholderia sp. SJ98]|jgi:hypothetical protein|nr:hypothetical protein BURK_008751 [Burkholderia sp. SJ98]
MLTREGADEAEIIVRPRTGGGWQVEVPSSEGIRITTVNTEQEALALARSVGPDMDVRLLPANDGVAPERPRADRPD